MNVKAIETVYKGYRFRSRLEARWAVFFDALGIEWEYEVEGFDMDGVRYLPDFKISPPPHAEHSEAWWVEVKPSSKVSDDDIAKMSCFVQGVCPHLLFVACGDPWINNDVYAIQYNFKRQAVDVVTGLLVSCPCCSHIAYIAFEGYSTDGERFKVNPDEMSQMRTNIRRSRTMDAYTAARSARFEYGETPRIQG